MITSTDRIRHPLTYLEAQRFAIIACSRSAGSGSTAAISHSWFAQKVTVFPALPPKILNSHAIPLEVPGIRAALLCLIVAQVHLNLETRQLLTISAAIGICSLTGLTVVCNSLTEPLERRPFWSYSTYLVFNNNFY